MKPILYVIAVAFCMVGLFFILGIPRQYAVEVGLIMSAAYLWGMAFPFFVR